MTCDWQLQAVAEPMPWHPYCGTRCRLHRRASRLGFSCISPYYQRARRLQDTTSNSHPQLNALEAKQARAETKSGSRQMQNGQDTSSVTRTQGFAVVIPACCGGPIHQCHQRNGGSWHECLDLAEKPRYAFLRDWQRHQCVADGVISLEDQAPSTLTDGDVHWMNSAGGRRRTRFP